MEEEYRRVTFKYGVLMLRTKTGISLLDRLGAFRVTKPLAWIMLYIMPVAAAAALFLILGTLTIFFSPQGIRFIEYVRTLTPLANVVFPGVNPYIPIVYGWIALIFAVFVHEASHGIVARSLGFPVKSAGLLLFLVIPIGAFVEVDDKQLKSAKARDSGRVLAAGSGINFIIAVISLLLLVATVGTMVPQVQGAGIVSVVQNTPDVHSAANLAGVRPGDFITAINDEPVDNLIILRDNSTFRPGQVINLTIWREGNTIRLDNLALGKIVVLDTRTNTTSAFAFLGVEQTSLDQLNELLGNYRSSILRNPLVYVCIPTLPRCQQFVPIADQWLTFYKSPLGAALPAVTSLLFWLWFINFNLAIFNSLPIYPMDGGQAFEAAVKSLGKGRITEDFARRITSWVTMLIVAMILVVVAGPYLSAFIF